MAGITRSLKSSVIKSIQRGQTVGPNAGNNTDVTITSVDTAKSFVSFSCALSDTSGGSTFTTAISAYLTSSTNLRIANTGERTLVNDSFAWEVIEYE